MDVVGLHATVVWSVIMIPVGRTALAPILRVVVWFAALFEVWFGVVTEVWSRVLLSLWSEGEVDLECIGDSLLEIFH